MNKSRQSGFSMVELAIVMIVIGLLTGGVLIGRTMIANAKMTATITQVRSYAAASQTFRSTYENWPGDMLNAATRLPGCTVNCAAGSYEDDEIIGVKAFSSGWNNQNVLPNGGAAPHRETTLFWAHMQMAGLISDVSDRALTATIQEWGVTHPPAKTRGGFSVGYVDNEFALPGSTVAPNMQKGHYLFSITHPNRAPNTNASVQVYSAREAAIIDRKMDDGNPALGKVQAFGVSGSCFGATTPPAYVEDTQPGFDCGLAFYLHK